MADTRGIRAGRAFVELGVSDKLSAGLRRAQKRLEAFGPGMPKAKKRSGSNAAVARNRDLARNRVLDRLSITHRRAGRFLASVSGHTAVDHHLHVAAGIDRVLRKHECIERAIRVESHRTADQHRAVVVVSKPGVHGKRLHKPLRVEGERPHRKIGRQRGQFVFVGIGLEPNRRRRRDGDCPRCSVARESRRKVIAGRLRPHRHGGKNSSRNNCCDTECCHDPVPLIHTWFSLNGLETHSNARPAAWQSVRTNTERCFVASFSVEVLDDLWTRNAIRKGA